MKLIAILIAKIILFFGNLFNRGSSLPGKIALELDKKIFEKLKYPHLRIVVTGSSGKGATSTLITQVLEKVGFSVCHNTEGSNLAWGVLTSLLKCSTLTGKIKSDYLVLEIDERYNKDILKYIKPNYLVLTNLTKDQPPRQHYVDIVYQELKSCIPKDTTIITLMDEPLLRSIEELPNKVIYFSLAKNKYSYNSQIFENLNITYCPNCASRLKYLYYNFETLGNYYCPNCDFKYEIPNTIGTKLDLTKRTLTFDNETITLGGDTLYTAYNTLASICTLKALNISSKDIARAINKINEEPFNPYFKNQTKLFRYFSCKSENAPTFNQALFKIIDDQKAFDIIIGWSIISKRYPYIDVSWLYDITFELLNNSKLNKIYVCGLNKDALKTRLILSGLPENKIIVKDDLFATKDEVLNDDVAHVYCISHYDYGNIFEKVFKEEDNND